MLFRRYADIRNGYDLFGRTRKCFFHASRRVGFHADDSTASHSTFVSSQIESRKGGGLLCNPSGYLLSRHGFLRFDPLARGYQGPLRRIVKLKIEVGTDSSPIRIPRATGADVEKAAASL